MRACWMAGLLAAMLFYPGARAAEPAPAKGDEPKAGLSAPVRQTPPPVRPADVQRMIRDLIHVIYESRTRGVHWDDLEEDPQQQDHTFGGHTALAVYALLAAGESPDNPKLKPAIAWLRKAKIHGTYAAGVRLNAYYYLPHQIIRPEAMVDQQYLFKAQIPQKHPETKESARGFGLYDYTMKFEPDRIDHSVSQYAVLGMWAAEQTGLPVPEAYWKTVEQAWLRDQNKDGGWNYSESAGDLSTGPMTAAGVATLFITQDYLRLRAPLRGDPDSSTTVPIDRGIDFMAKRLDKNWADVEPYELYGIERVGIASGLKTFGKVDWYDAGVRAIVAKYFKSGALGESKVVGSALHDVCFSLLFLARGQNPFLVNKLRYDGPWNEHPREAANLSKWYSKRIESELLWQIVSIDSDPLEMHDAPVMIMSGSGELKLTDKQKAALRQFMEDGGLLIASANAQDDAFVHSMKLLLGELFPQFPARPLAADHLAMSSIQVPSRPVQIMGVSNGIRELCLLLHDGDTPRDWAMMRLKEKPESFEVAANILAYATDKGRFRVRGDGHAVSIDPEITPARTATLGRIQHGGNWNPEPGGWRRINALLHNQNSVSLKIEPIKLGDGALAGQKFAHWTGTEPFVLSETEIADLRGLIARGGTLIVDAAGGNEDFARSVEKELPKLIAGSQWEPIAADDPIFADTKPKPLPYTKVYQKEEAPPKGAKPLPISVNHADGPLSVEYRRFGRASGQATGLEIKGLRVGRRWAVVFSPHDLTAGLVGHNVDGIRGYAPATATEIVRRVIVNSK